MEAPRSLFARAHGYEEYMPYLCNLDYVMYGLLGVPLRREHTCFEDGDYCDFKVKCGDEALPYWPPVFTQGEGYKFEVPCMRDLTFGSIAQQNAASWIPSKDEQSTRSYWCARCACARASGTAASTPTQGPTPPFPPAT